jgi:hypothetical protein
VRHERQSEKRRMATRWSYGHGIGAACGILCRKGDWYGLTILARWLRSVTMRILRAASAVDANGLRQARLSLTGTLRGLAYGWGVGPEASGERVKDERETAR